MSDTLVVKLSPIEMAALENRLRGGTFAWRDVPHAVFAAKGEGVNCVLYRSGKCVIQGKGSGDFLAHYLADHEVAEKPITAAFSTELLELAVGSDESGKGDYFGPLVVAAVAHGPDDVGRFEGIRLGDSKAISPTVIRTTAAAIRERLPHAIVVIKPERYNELYAKMQNLNRLLAWAHGVALEEVMEKVDAKLLVVDKFCDEGFFRRSLKEKSRAARLVFRTKAESHPAVGAASILATDAFRSHLAWLGKEVDLTLPKGASKQVELAARRLVSVKGPGILPKVAKMHFRTTAKVLVP